MYFNLHEFLLTYQIKMEWTFCETLFYMPHYTQVEEHQPRNSFFFLEISTLRENATENRNEVLEWNRYKTLKGIRRMKITYQPT